MDKENETSKEEQEDQENTLKHQEDVKEKEKEIAELQEKLRLNLSADNQRIAELEDARKHDAGRIAELQAAQDQQEIASYLKDLETMVVHNGSNKFLVSPSAIKLVAPLVKGTAKTAIIELAESSTPARQAIEQLFKDFIKLAAEGSLLVPITEMGSVPQQDANKSQRSVLEQAQALQKEKDIDYHTALLQVQQQ